MNILPNNRYFFYIKIPCDNADMNTISALSDNDNHYIAITLTTIKKNWIGTAVPTQFFLLTIPANNLTMV